METSLAIFLPFLLTGGLIGWWQGVCKRVYAPGPQKKGALGGGWLPAGVVTLSVLFLSFGPQSFLEKYIHPLITAQFATLSITAILAAGVGIKEDKLGIPISTLKHGFIILLIAAYTFILGPTFLGVPFLVDKTITLLIWVIIIRSIFMVDTLDGFAVVHVTAILFGLAFFVKPVNFIVLPTIGAILAFLRFNRPKAILFWGESGRLWLGTILGGLWVTSVGYTPDNAQSATLFILLLPLILGGLFTLKPWHTRAQNIGLSDGQILFKTAYLYGAIFICTLISFAAKAPLIFIPIGIGILVLVALRVRYLENAK